MWVPALEDTGRHWPSTCIVAEDREKKKKEADEEKTRGREANISATSQIPIWMWKKTSQIPTWTWKNIGGRLTTSGMMRAYLQ